MFQTTYEQDLLMPKGVGRTDMGGMPGGTQKTTRLIMLLHETSHLLHDLSLGTLIVCDYIRDQSSGLLTRALHILSEQGGEAKVPLIAAGSIHDWLADPKLKDLATGILICENMQETLLGTPSGLVRYCEEREWFRDAMNNVPDLSGEAICEGLVAAKTVINLSDRINGPEDAEYLEVHKHALHLFPDNLPLLYNTARRVYDKAFGDLLNPRKWNTEEVWPLRYYNSPCFLSDLGFIYLADIALHIPPEFVSDQRISEGRNSPNDFNPAFRFCMAIDYLRRRGGMPEADTSKSPEYFYVTLFDSIASDPQLRWPTFQETSDAWKAFLWQAKKTRRESVDGYRYRLIVEREKAPHTVVTKDPILVCWGQGVPIMHLKPSGFEILRGIKTGSNLNILPLVIGDMAVREMFRSEIPLWEDAPTEVSSDQLGSYLEGENNKAMLLHQEAIYRSICTEFRTSVLYNDHYSCPFTPQGCNPGEAPCLDQKRIEKNCIISDYLAQDNIDPTCIIWGS
jgi:hypothetical protein